MRLFAPAVSCPFRGLIAAIAMAALGSISTLWAEGGPVSPVVKHVTVVTGDVSVSTNGSFTTIVATADHATVPYTFRVQWQTTPALQLSYGGRATVLYSPGTVAFLPVGASAPAYVFTALREPSLPVTLDAPHAQVIHTVGIASYEDPFSAPSAASATRVAGPPMCPAECTSGGSGSSSCNITCGNGCSVTCDSQYDACCNCLPQLSCICCVGG